MTTVHLDMESLNALKDVMGDEFSQLVHTFVSDSDVRIETIREAVNVADPEALRRAAHSLKGSASNMGALGLTQLCRQLEDMGHEGKTEGSQQIFEQVNQEYLIVRDQLQAL